MLRTININFQVLMHWLEELQLESGATNWEKGVVLDISSSSLYHQRNINNTERHLWSSTLKYHQRNINNTERHLSQVVADSSGKHTQDCKSGVGWEETHLTLKNFGRSNWTKPRVARSRTNQKGNSTSDFTFNCICKSQPNKTYFKGLQPVWGSLHKRYWRFWIWKSSVLGDTF